MKLATQKRHKGRGKRQLDDGDAHLHVHAEGRNSTLQLLLRSLGVIFSDQAVREAETLRVINMLQQTSNSNPACLGVVGFYFCCAAGAASAPTQTPTLVEEV